MSTVELHVHVPGRRVPARLTTTHAASSYGVPVLVMDGGPSHGGQEVPYGPGDITRWGVAACLLLESADPREAGETEEERHRSPLSAWNRECARYRARRDHPVTMAETWLAAGGWSDGAVRFKGPGRSLLDELDRAPLHREAARHVVPEQEGPGTEGASWTFPDGSGVVEVGDGCEVFDRGGRTPAGRIVRKGEAKPWASS